MTLDPRIIRFGVEVNGQMRVYEDAWIVANGTKYANALQNECTIAVANLAKEVRHYLLTETSPFNRNRTRKKVMLEVGRKSIGTARIFLGDIVSITPSQPPDIILTIKAKTGYFQMGNIVALEAPAATSNLSVIADSVAQSMGLELMFEADDKKVQNFNYTGSALQATGKLGEAGGVNAYVDDDRLVVKNYGAPLKGYTHVLSAESGMIGIPEADEFGCKVRIMMDPRIRLGSRIQLRSAINPAMDGNYTVYKLGFNVATRDNAFEWTAYCTRDGWTNGKLIPQ